MEEGLEAEERPISNDHSVVARDSGGGYGVSGPEGMCLSLAVRKSTGLAHD